MRCENCGAQYRGDTCEYCGSVYESKQESKVSSWFEIDANGIRFGTANYGFAVDECAYRDAKGILRRVDNV